MADISKARDLFWAAVDIESPADRASFLDRECGINGELRARVDALLAAHADAGSFLDTAVTPARDDSAAQATQTWVATDSEETAVGTPQDTGIRIDSNEPVTPTGSEGKAGGKPGGRFGDYEIERELARGGMGVVFQARQISLNRPVALKMILASQLASKDEVERFHVEAEAAAKLDHPGIVPIYEVGEQDGQHFFSMGLVDGGSLKDLVEGGPLSCRKAAELVRTIAEAVQYAHARNIVHRDLKPANILLDAAGRPKVTDFGLAKNVEGDSGLTATGQIMGTPSFMPPEQAGGRMSEVGPLADVYSLGGILYYLVTARPPFEAGTAVETLRHVLERDAVSPRSINPAVDLDLATICLKCLEKEPVRRYASAAELADELGRYLHHEPIVARPLGRSARFGRWCRRNPLLAGLIGLTIASLIGGTGTATYFGIKATDRAEELEDKQNELNASAEDLKRLNRQLMDDMREFLTGTWDVRTEIDVERIRKETDKEARFAGEITRNWTEEVFGQPAVLEEMVIRKDGTCVRKTITKDDPNPQEGMSGTWQLVERDGRNVVLRMKFEGVLPGFTINKDFKITVLNRDILQLDEYEPETPVKPTIFRRKK